MQLLSALSSTTSPLAMQAMPTLADPAGFASLFAGLDAAPDGVMGEAGRQAIALSGKGLPAELSAVPVPTVVPAPVAADVAPILPGSATEAVLMLPPETAAVAPEPAAPVIIAAAVAIGTVANVLPEPTPGETEAPRDTQPVRALPTPVPPRFAVPAPRQRRTTQTSDQRATDDMPTPSTEPVVATVATAVPSASVAPPTEPPVHAVEVAPHGQPPMSVASPTIPPRFAAAPRRQQMEASLPDRTDDASDQNRTATPAAALNDPTMPPPASVEPLPATVLFPPAVSTVAAGVVPTMAAMAPRPVVPAVRTALPASDAVAPADASEQPAPAVDVQRPVAVAGRAGVPIVEDAPSFPARPAFARDTPAAVAANTASAIAMQQRPAPAPGPVSATVAAAASRTAPPPAGMAPAYRPVSTDSRRTPASPIPVIDADLIEVADRIAAALPIAGSITVPPSDDAAGTTGPREATAVPEIVTAPLSAAATPVVAAGLREPLASVANASATVVQTSPAIGSAARPASRADTSPAASEAAFPRPTVEAPVAIPVSPRPAPVAGPVAAAPAVDATRQILPDVVVAPVATPVEPAAAKAPPITRVAPAPSSPHPDAVVADAIVEEATLVSRPRREDDVAALPTAAPIPDTAITRPVTAPVTAGQPMLDTRSTAWMEGMIDHIETLQGAGGAQGETRIRLSPDALGNVEISIRTADDGSVQVRFNSENADAGRLLADAQPRLVQLAEARGLKLGGMQVDVGTQQQQQRQAQEQPAAPPRGPRSAPTATDTHQPDNRIA